MSEPERPQWNDIFTPLELAAAIDLHAYKIARMAGWYEAAQDLHHAAECIRDLGDRIEMCASKAEDLQETVERIQRKARAALESFSDVP